MKREYTVRYDSQEIFEETRNKNPLDFLKEMQNKYPNYDILEVNWIENGQFYRISVLGKD